MYLKCTYRNSCTLLNRKIVIMRSVGIQEFTCFIILPFHQEITISRSLGGKYTF